MNGVILPKTVERMNDREKEKYAKALAALAAAVNDQDWKTANAIMEKFNLKAWSPK